MGTKKNKQVEVVDIIKDKHVVVLSIRQSEMLVMVKHLRTVLPDFVRTLPVLSWIRMTCIYGEVRFEATDLEQRAVYCFPALPDAPDIDILLDAGWLENILQLQEGMLELVISGTLGVELHSRRRWDLFSGTGPEKSIGRLRTDLKQMVGDYPVWPARAPVLASMPFDPGKFHCAGAMASTDYSRGVLCGVNIDHEHITGTDGKRLYRSPHGIPGQQGLSLTLPYNTRIRRILAFPDGAKVRLDIYKETADITHSACRITVKLPGGTYPNYRQVIPSEFQHRFTVDDPRRFEKVLTLLKRQNVENEMFHLSEGRLIFQTVPETFGCSGNVPALDFCLNPKFLLSYLQVAAPGRVEWQMNDGTSPMQINGEFIQMPVIDKR